VLLGRTRSGSLKLSEDAKGLRFELELPDTSHARDVIALAERNLLGGMSFGFVATDESWDGDVRELRAVDLHEISVVQAWPAYQSTEVSLRNRPKQYQMMVFGGANSAWLETCR
ncbi:MAG: HK97 family phage prohead protease, partial [Comamonadaceae bacterium]